MFKKSATYICILFMGMMGLFGVNITNYGAIEWWVINTYAEVDDYCPSWNCGKTPDAKMQEMLQSLVAGLNIFLNILTIFVSPAIVLASWLMSPDWTSGDLFQIRPMIHELWIVVSNVTYFIYAILLIFIAMATIFNSDKYWYKQLLPKLALGIIMVPLSWWFIQFIISLSTLITASVISIPSEVVMNYNKGNADSWWSTPSIPKETTFNNQKPEPSKPCAPKWGAAGPNEQVCITPENFIKTGGGMYSSLMVYSFAVFKFQDVKMLNSTTQKVQSIGDIINQWLVWSIMFIVYGLLVLALIFMLMIRAIKLWFYAIFSPFMTLKFVLGEGMFKDKNDSFDLKEFIGLAFVPAIVGLALSFGLIIVSVMIKPAPSVTPWCNPTECKITLFGNKDSTITTKAEGTSTGKIIKTTITTGGASYSYIGDVTSGNPTGNIMSAINMWGGILGTIIVDIIALIFIWVAFMAAKGVSKVAATAFAPFEQIGERMGSLAASIPKYTPIPGTGGMSVNSMAKVPTMLETGLQNYSEKKFGESEIWWTLKRLSGASESVDRSKMTEANNATDNKISAKKWVELSGQLEAQGKLGELANKTNSDQINALKSKNISEDQWKDGWLRPADAKQLVSLLKKDSLNDDEKKIMAVLMAWRWDNSGDTKVGKFDDVLRNPSKNNTANGWNNTTWVTTPPKDWIGTIVVNWTSIAYTWMNLNDNADVLGKKIAGYLNLKAKDMKMPTDDQIREIANWLWVDEWRKEETIKQIKASLSRADAWKSATTTEPPKAK